MKYVAYLCSAIAAIAATPPPDVVPFDAPKFGLKVEIPKAWEVGARERADKIFVAFIKQADPERPGVAVCELGLAPETLEEYRTRLEASLTRRGRPGKLVRNEVVASPKGPRLETLVEYAPDAADGPWHELSIRRIENRQLYTFILSVNDATWQGARPAFETLIDSAVFSAPNTGADLVDKATNRWNQREFKFAIDLPTGWAPALAPAEEALLFANGAARGIWSDNVLVIAQPKRPTDLKELRATFPEQLKAARPECEVLSCEIVKQGKVEALETVVRVPQGPFTMTILERRFPGERFDYEVKATVESKRFDALAPSLRKCLDSFAETPGAVPAAGRARAG